MIPTIKTEQDLRDVLKNIADMSTQMQHYPQACCDLSLGLVIYFRGRVLDRLRHDQERLWSQSQGGSAIPVLLACMTIAIIVSALLSWYWSATWLTVGLCCVCYIMILADCKGVRIFRKEGRKQGASPDPKHEESTASAAEKGE